MSSKYKLKGGIRRRKEAKLRRNESAEYSSATKINPILRQKDNGDESRYSQTYPVSLLKRGYTGTFHPISAKHLSRYVNEFAFRLNEGNAGIDTMDRMTALVQGMSGKRLAYKDLTK